MKLDNNTFEANYCPECGGSLDTAHPWTIYGAGRGLRCNDCRKEWHIIWENYKDFEEEEEK